MSDAEHNEDDQQSSKPVVLPIQPKEGNVCSSPDPEENAVVPTAEVLDTTAETQEDSGAESPKTLNELSDTSSGSDDCMLGPDKIYRKNLSDTGENKIDTEGSSNQADDVEIVISDDDEEDEEDDSDSSNSTLTKSCLAANPIKRAMMTLSSSDSEPERAAKRRRKDKANAKNQNGSVSNNSSDETGSTDGSDTSNESSSEEVD